MSLSPIAPGSPGNGDGLQGKSYRKTTFGTFNVQLIGRFKYGPRGLEIIRCESYFVLFIQQKKRKTVVVSPDTKIVKFKGETCKHIIFLQLYSQCNLTPEVMKNVETNHKFFKVFNHKTSTCFSLKAFEQNRLQCPVCDKFISSIEYFNSHYKQKIANYKWYKQLYIENSPVSRVSQIAPNDHRQKLTGNETQSEIEDKYNNWSLQSIQKKYKSCPAIDVSVSQLSKFMFAQQSAKIHFENLYLRNCNTTTPKTTEK